MSDPRTVVRSSTMLWGSQVSLIEALDLRDADPYSDEIGELAGRLAALRERRQPYIYEFGKDRNYVRFLQPNPVYGE